MIEKCLGIPDLLNNKETWPKEASVIPEESGPADTFASVVKKMAYEDPPLSPVSMESLRWFSDDEFE
uniref:Uncharacterized protein n=1 Tax=Anopheles atroparvus TaxID=41427 RepID=A0AAG5DX49_ANOAO